MKFYTYHEVAAMFGVTVRTVQYWFRKRRKFHPTPNTVRITQAQLDAFILASCRQPLKK